MFDAVAGLTAGILNRRHHIFFDNAYTSIPLALHFLQNNTYCCGTVRGTRKNLPNCVKVDEKTLARGEFIVAQDQKNPELCATVWRDTKCVRFLSTNSNPTLSTVASRRIAGVRQNVRQPIAAQSYGRWMGGVDRADSLRGNVGIGRVSKKSWKYLFYFGMNAAMVNAWIFFRSHSTLPGKWSHTRFRHQVALGLLRNYMKRKTKAKTARHKHVKLRRRGRRCKMHRKYKPDEKDVYDTQYGCSFCNIHLCTLCFTKYHASL
jgi:hypothetical protein